MWHLGAQHSGSAPSQVSGDPDGGWLFHTNTKLKNIQMFTNENQLHWHSNMQQKKADLKIFLC